MYYLIDARQNVGINFWLIAKVDNYSNGMQVNCGGSAIVGTGLVLITQISVICNATGLPLNVSVYR